MANFGAILHNLRLWKKGSINIYFFAYNGGDSTTKAKSHHDHHPLVPFLVA